MMESSRKPFKNARKKLEIPEAAMPCKLKTTKCSHRHREIDSRPYKIQKSKRACIVEVPESTRKRLEGTLPKEHEDHVAERVFNSLSHHNLVHKFIPSLQAMKFLDARAAVDKDWEKLETMRSWQITKVKSRREVILEA